MGKVIMSGIVPTLKAPVTGVLASSLAVGSTVKLLESGTAVEYLVVNQGIPSNSSLYDSSCDGTWLLRKDIHSKRVWNSSGSNAYNSSGINTWLNGEFFNSLGSVEQAAIKQLKVPYCVGGGSPTVKSGANGLSVKAFLLGGYELGVTGGSLPSDGAKLSYFEAGNGTSANSKRIANFSGNAVFWELRSSHTERSASIFNITFDGGLAWGNASSQNGVRPALVLPSSALFDETTLLLKGVA